MTDTHGGDQVVDKIVAAQESVIPRNIPSSADAGISINRIFVLARMEAEVWSAYGFIGFSVAYLCLAPLSKNERLGRLLRYSTEDEAAKKHLLSARFKILVLPLILGFVFIVLIFVVFGESGVLSQVGSFLPATLGGLFVLWAIAPESILWISDHECHQRPRRRTKQSKWIFAGSLACDDINARRCDDLCSD